MISVRLAKPSDIDLLVAMEKSIFDRADEQRHMFRVESFRKALKDSRHVVYIAHWYSNVFLNPAGLLVGSFHPRLPCCRVEDIGTVDAFRGKGVARALVDAFAKRAIKLGSKRMWLETALNERNGATAFRKMGFVRKRLLIGYYGPGTRAVKMLRELT